MSAVLPSPVGAGTIVPRRAMLLGIRGWTGVTIALAVVAVIVPIANRTFDAKRASQIVFGPFALVTFIWASK